MICINLEGGLGNQMFQYAAGRALAARWGCDLLLETSSLGRQKRRTSLRHFELRHFNYIGRVTSRAESIGFRLLRRVGPLAWFVRRWKCYCENGFDFNPAINNLPPYTFLVGYWQSYHYFSEIAKQLANEFTPVSCLSPLSLAFSKSIESCQSVALHVRRGDYVSLSSAANFHGALPLSYYVNATERVRNQITAPTFFVFSDDADWCRSNFALGDSAVFIDHNLGSDAWQDMILMSRCRHHVIANSSFSWWGAWLADQRPGVDKRMVVAPGRWFRSQSGSSSSDRLPSHWETID